MSAKIQPFDSSSGAGSGKYRNRGSFDNESEFQDLSTKSPRSPRVGGKLSRQNSFGDTRSISRQNSTQQGGSSKHSRRNLIEDEGADAITDHSGASSARGPHSSRGTSSKHKSKKHSTSSKSGKKRVSFKIPLIDPRPEKMQDNSATYGADNSLNDEEFAHLENYDASDPTTPRRMKKRRRGSQGRWRRYIPFGQYIPTLPTFTCSIFGGRRRRDYVD